MSISMLFEKMLTLSSRREREEIRLERAPRNALTTEDRREIATLYMRSIERPARSMRRSIDTYDEFYLGRDPSGELCLTTGITRLHLELEGRAHVVIMTGLVAIAPQHRGRGLTIRIGIEQALRCRARYPRARVYWGFTCSTLNAYLLMARNFETHWPRHERRPTPTVQALMDTLGARYDNYDPRSFIIQMPELTPREGLLSAEHSAQHPDPQVRFFGASLPGAARGDALLCLCPMTAANLLAITRRQLGKLSPQRRLAKRSVLGSSS